MPLGLSSKYFSSKTLRWCKRNNRLTRSKRHASMYGMALPKYTADQRREAAAVLQIDEQYVYQILTKLRTASPALARQFHEYDPTAILQDLRPHDWAQIWPELISQAGAPTPETAKD